MFVGRSNGAVIGFCSRCGFNSPGDSLGCRFAARGTGGHLFEFSDRGYQIDCFGSERVDGAAKFFSRPLSERFGFSALLLSPLAGQCGDS
ncbi:MAG: hypothetical protein ACK559_09180, partial [bacterium]